MSSFEVTLTVFIDADTEAQAREIVEDNLGCLDGFNLGSCIVGIKSDKEKLQTSVSDNWFEP